MSAGREGDEALARGLDELDAIRRRVVNVVGHSLRTPVTTLVGMANALENTDDPATRKQLIDGLTRNAARVERLLDDLLLAAGVTTTLPAGDPAPTSVHTAFARAWLELVGPTELDVRGEDVKPLVRAAALERIAHLVLDNALKYGDHHVSLSSEVTPTGVRIEIESIGDTPSDDELAHAFELFYRGEHAVMAAPGLGIGLPVARELAHAEGGEVGLERRGLAMVATVELPG